MTTYYVSPTGSASNAGTSESLPWNWTKVQTQALVNGFFSGDTILLQRGGTYTGRAYFEEQGPLTIGAYGSGARPIITGAGALSAFQAVLGFDSCDRVDLADLTVRNEIQANTYAVASVHLINQYKVRRITIRRCDLGYAGLEAVFLGYGSAWATNEGALVEDCTISYCGDNGVGGYGYLRDIVVRRCAFSYIGRGTADLSLVFGGDGVSFHERSHGIVEDCTFDYCRDGIHHINYPETSVGSITRRCRFRNCSESALELNDYELQAATPRIQHVVESCIIDHPATATGQGAIVIGRDGAVTGLPEAGIGGIASVRITNCTINNESAGYAIFASYRDSALSSQQYLHVENVSFTGAGPLVSVERRGRTPSLTFRSNAYETDVADGWQRDGTDMADLSEWQALGYDTDATIAANGLNADLIPVGSSRLIGAGSNLALMASESRGYGGEYWRESGSWDIGASAVSGAIMDLTTTARVASRVKPGMTTLGTNDDLLVAQMITDVSGQAERYLDRHTLTTSRSEYLDVRADQTAWRLKGYPVTALTSVIYDPEQAFDAADALDDDEYDDPTLEAAGVLTMPQPFDSTDRKALKVTYTGGMGASTAAFISAYPEIAMAVEMQVVWHYLRRLGIGTQGRSGDRGSDTLVAGTPFIAEVKTTLDMHRRWGDV